MMVAVAIFPSAVAVMVAFPSATAVTNPLLTVATLALLVVHVTFLLVALVGLTVAVNCNVFPTFISTAVLSN